MRLLRDAPPDAIDPVSGAPRFGSYRGGLSRIDLTSLRSSTIAWAAHHKRWMYVGIAAEDCYAALAIVRFGYVANAFGYVYDRVTQRLVAQSTVIAPPVAALVGETAGEGCLAEFSFQGRTARIERRAGSTQYAIRAQLGELSIDGEIDALDAPPPITAVAQLSAPRDVLPPNVRLDVTEKRVLLSASADLRCRGVPRKIHGALAGYDYTQGILPRRTSWRWAFAMGHTKDGVPVGLNLVDGFCGESECALWLGRDLVPLTEANIDSRPQQPYEPWRVRTRDRRADLVLTPGAVHTEHRHLVLVQTAFLQAVGEYSGRIALEDGRDVELDSVLGVAEDHDARW
jgi:hypothetical protein